MTAETSGYWILLDGEPTPVTSGEWADWWTGAKVGRCHIIATFAGPIAEADARAYAKGKEAQG